MAKEDTKKDIQKISSLTFFRNFLTRTVDQIEEGVGLVKFVTILLILLIVVPIGWLISTSLKKEKLANAIDPKVQEFQNKDEARYNSPKKINEPIELDSVSWTLLSVKDYGSEIKAESPELIDCKAPDKKKFVSVTMTITSHREKAFVLKNPPLYTALKVSYGTFQNIPLCVLEEASDGTVLLSNQAISPDQTMLVRIFYAVPEEAKDFKIGVYDADYLGIGIPREVMYIALGI